MKRTESRLIKLPSILKPKKVAGLSKEKTDETNLRSYNFGKRTAIPLLEKYPINSLANALKDMVFQKAIEEVGLDSDGYLDGSFSDFKKFGNRKFFVRTYSYTEYPHESTLSKINGIFGKTVTGNLEDVDEESIKKLGRTYYIWVDYLINTMEEAKEYKSTRSNRRDLSIIDLSTGKKAKLDKTINRMRVYFDKKRYSQLIKANADEHFNAKSLKANTESFLESYEKERMKKFGIPTKGLEEDIPLDFELTDGSTVSYLFYPKITTKHGEIYKGIVGKTTKDIARSTGDLNIIKELAFKEDYEFLKGGVGITVFADVGKKKGKIRIIRTYKDGKEERKEEGTYSILDDDNRIFVKVRDVLKAYEKLKGKYTSDPITHIKIDFFLAPPKHLI